MRLGIDVDRERLANELGIWWGGLAWCVCIIAALWLVVLPLLGLN